MTPRFVPLAVFSALGLLVPLVARAQPAPPPPAPPAAARPPAAAAPAAPRAPGAAPAGQPTPPPVPPSIDINDPMLEPVPPPAKQLSNWREALALVNTHSADLIIARQEIEKQRGQARIAWAGALPSLTGTGTYTHNLVTHTSNIPAQTILGTEVSPATSVTAPTADIASAVLTASMPIIGVRAWYGIGTANRVVKIAELSVDDKERTVLLVVANAIVSVVTLERVAEINRNGLKSALQVVELTERKQRLGSGTKLDVLRTQQDAATARATLISGDESLRQARENLGLSLGASDGWGVSPNISLNEVEGSIRSICSTGTIENRADILAQKATLEVDERLVTDSYLAYAPTLNAVSALSATTPQAPGFPPYTWTIGGLLTVPIWEGGARYGATRIAKAQVEEQKATLDLTTRGATVQNVQAVRSVVVAENARAVSEQTRNIAKETARLTQIAFEAGTGTSFDLVDSATKLRQAELDLAVKEFGLVQAKLSALLATANCKY